MTKLRFKTPAPPVAKEPRAKILVAMDIAHSLRADVSDLAYLADSFAATGNFHMQKVLGRLAQNIHDKMNAISNNIGGQIQDDCRMSEANLQQTLGLAFKLLIAEPGKK